VKKIKNIPLLQQLSQKLPLPLHKKPLPLNKKPLPLPPKPIAPRHYYEEVDQFVGVDQHFTKSDEGSEVNSLEELATKPTDNTKGIYMNGSNVIHEKLLEIEEKIKNILSRLSKLEDDVISLRSKRVEEEAVSLAINRDTSPAQVCLNFFYYNQLVLYVIINNTFPCK